MIGGTYADYSTLGRGMSAPTLEQAKTRACAERGGSSAYRWLFNIAALTAPLWLSAVLAGATLMAGRGPILYNMGDGGILLIIVIVLGTFAGLVPIVRAESMRVVEKIIVSVIYVPVAFFITIIGSLLGLQI